jgi:hypothetical protein
MKHLLTLDQQLAGARKALVKVEQKVLCYPRYRGLVVGLKKNILKLEAVLAMPYKDRETYLRKQREFHQQRKARKKLLELQKARTQPSGVSPHSTLTPHASRLQNGFPKKGETRPPVSGSNSPLSGVNNLSSATAYLTRLTPLTPNPPRAKAGNQAPATSILPPGINKPTARERFHVDDCGNARRVVKPDEV